MRAYYLRDMSEENSLKPNLDKSIQGKTEKSFISSYNRQFFTNIRIQFMKLIPVMLARSFGAQGLTKMVSFNICGKLSIIRCDK